MQGTDDPQVTRVEALPVDNPGDPVDMPPAPLVAPPQADVYTPEQRSLALAAVERFGFAGASRLLAVEWGAHMKPSASIMRRWKQTGVEVQEEHRTFWIDHDAQARNRLRAAIEPRIYTALDAFDFALEEGDFGDGQRLAIAAGILIDKVMPPVKSGAAAPLVGSAHMVQMLVVSPAEIEGRRRDHEPEGGVLEEEVTDGES